MSPSTRRHIVCLVLGLACLYGVIFLQGCAHDITAYPVQPPMVSPVARNIESVTLKMKWHDSVDEMNRACNGDNAYKMLSYGCAKVSIKTPLECELHATVPKDFNDTPRLLILGHELTHCFLMLH